MIPDFLEDKFTGMTEEDICAYITKALARDSTITDRLCLDMRIDQLDNFSKILNSLEEIKSNMVNGVVLAAGSHSEIAASSASISQEIQEEKYVALELGDNDDDNDAIDFAQFIM